MWFLYLDESGDLGFDFAHKRPSNFFTISILAIQGVDKNRDFINAIKKTVKRKFIKKKKSIDNIELKGYGTSIDIKKYFYEQVKDISFSLYSLTLDKRKVVSYLFEDKDRVYNYVARLALKKIRFENAKSQVELVVDKSKGQKQIKEFNNYIEKEIKTRLNPKVPLNIKHLDSKKNNGLQAADVFCWGIFRSYEVKDTEWLSVFKEKIKYNEIFVGYIYK